MADAKAAIRNRPAWVELATSDTEAARAFYSKLLGWDVKVTDDPQYGDYGLAKVGGEDAAGIGGKMSPDAPTAWSLYIGTEDADGLAKRIQDAGGTVAAPPFEIPGMGRMAVFQDPAGAFISSWEPAQMSGFTASGTGAFGWADLNARGIEKAIPFYEQVFGWTHRTHDMGEGAPSYTEFQSDGQSILGAMEMPPMVPAEVPSHWLVYFSVDDVDASFKAALEGGGREMMAPMDFPGGRFAIVSDPQGAAFGMLRMQAPA